MGDRVVITGLGIVSSIGCDREIFWDNLINGRDNIKKIELPVFRDMRSSLAGRVEELLCPEDMTKGAAFAQKAVLCAIEDGGLTEEQIRQCGIVAASANGGMDMMERYIRSGYTDKELIRQYPTGYLMEDLIEHFGFEGPGTAVATACASGSMAVALGCEMIRDGETERVIAGGSEPLSYTIMGGFNCLRAASETGCAPFDRARDGMIVAEGAAFLILESLEAARARGAHIYCELSGWGMSCDAYNMTNPNGKGLEAAMRSALLMAGIRAHEVDYINAHGTGTPANDTAEINAITAVLGEDCSGAVSSTKAVHGHMLGAAGAVEAAVCALSIDRGTVPPNANLREAESSALNIPRKSLSRELSNVISNSQAFGGSNIVLVFRKVEDGNGE